MRLCTFIFFQLFLLIYQFAAADEYKHLLDTFSQVQQSLRQTKTHDVCNTNHTGEGYDIAQTLPQAKTELGKLQTKNKKEFEISVVTLDQAKNIFNQILTHTEIPFNSPKDACDARAHKMSRILEAEGIITGKVFITGNLRVETKNTPKGFIEWGYHVASSLLVKDHDEIKEYIIDPSIFDHPVPVQEWYDIQTKHKEARIDNIYQTPRFNYTPTSAMLGEDLQRYHVGDLISMWQTLAEARAEKIKIETEK